MPYHDFRDLIALLNRHLFCHPTGEVELSALFIRYQLSLFDSDGAVPVPVLVHFAERLEHSWHFAKLFKSVDSLASPVGTLVPRSWNVLRRRFEPQVFQIDLNKVSGTRAQEVKRRLEHCPGRHG